jgi:pyrimidine-nucleoside phosphorylase
MENEADAVKLAKIMVEIGNNAGRRTVAAITEMGQPLGKAVGNSLEVIEAIETLKGNGPADITELSEILSGIMVYLGGKAETAEQGIEMTKAALADGSGLEKLAQFIEAQGGNKEVIHNYQLFPQHSVEKTLKATSAGYVEKIEAKRIGLASQHTGAGRATKEDEIDLSAGILVCKKVGDEVAEGDTLAIFYGNDEAKIDAAMKEAAEAFKIGNTPIKPPTLIKEIIGF